MGFFLSSLQEKMKSEGEGLLDAILPLLKLLTLALIGLILAHPKLQILPKSTFKLLSKLVFTLFLPCLIFTNLGPSINLKNFLIWWFIPVNVVISTAVGCILGLLVAGICRPPPEYFRFTIIMTGFGNTGNLPLSIVSSVCHNSHNPFGAQCYGNGVAYVSFSQWVSVILVYTLVYYMMEPPLKHCYEVVKDEENEIEEEEELGVNNLSRPLLLEAEWPGMEDIETEHCKTPFIATLFNVVGESQTNIPDNHESMEDENENPKSPESIRCFTEPKIVRKIRIAAKQTPIHQILQPPTMASLLAIIIGIIPTAKSVFFGSDAPLSFITDSLNIMASAMVPSAMLVLGGMLAEGPKESKLGIRTTIGIIVARLLVLPSIGIGIVFLVDKMGVLIQGDQLYRFVLLLQYTTPSAILLGAVASLRGYGVREASAVLFWQHVCAVFSVSFYVIVYFKLLLSYI